MPKKRKTAAAARAEKTAAAARAEKQSRTKGLTVPPVMLRRLIEAITMAKTARELGVTTTTLHRSLNANAVSKVIEVAAEGKLREHAGDAAAAAGLTPNGRDFALRSGHTAMLLMEVDTDKLEAMEKLVQAMGAKLRSI